MNEMVKTLIYGGVALVFGGAGWLVYRGSIPEKVSPDEAVDKLLFDGFESAADAVSLETIRYDEKLAKIDHFKVAKVDGRWVIPSHGNYPADAADRMRDAAAMLLGLRSIAMVSDDEEKHAEYGVVEPDENKLKTNSAGVGTMIVLEGAQGKGEGKLIVGKKVKNDPETRFARVPGQARVIVVKIDLDKLSEKFEDWIERDVLKFNPLDLQQAMLRDYGILQGQLYFQSDVALNYDGSHWSLENFLRFTREGPVEVKLAEDEELNSELLDDFKSAIDDLKIVHVSRKAKAVAENLENPQMISDRDSLVTLAQRGFYFRPLDDNKLSLAGANGDVVLRMKDGVEYVLRFGEVAVAASGDSSVSRYLLATAKVNVDKPALAPIPDEPAGPTTPAPGSTPAAGTSAPPAEGDPKTPPKTPEGSGANPENPDEDELDDEIPPKDSADPAAKEEAPAKPPAAPPAEKDPTNEVIEKIKKENQRKLDEYNDKVKKATVRVAELNARFKDWYFVIPDDVYRKLHLSANDLVRESKPSGVDAFREIQKDGVKGPAKGHPPGIPGGNPLNLGL